MDDIQQSRLGSHADASLTRLPIRTGILVARKLVQKDLSGLFESDAMSQQIFGRFLAIPDKALPSSDENISIYLLYI
jgi:hypothetical protein